MRGVLVRWIRAVVEVGVRMVKWLRLLLLVMMLLELFVYAHAKSHLLEKIVMRGHRPRRGFRSLRRVNCPQVCWSSVRFSKWLGWQGAIATISHGVVLRVLVGGIHAGVREHMGNGGRVRVIGRNGFWRSVIAVGRRLRVTNGICGGWLVVFGAHVCGGNLTMLRLLGKFHIVGEIGVKTKFIHLNLGLRGSRGFSRGRSLVFSRGSPVRQQGSSRLGTWNSWGPGSLNDQVFSWVVFFLPLRFGHPFEVIRFVV